MPFFHSTHYLDHGQGSPLVLLHGLASRAEDWGLQVPAFSPHYRVLAPDLRAHGRSAASRWFTIEQMADDVAGLLDQFGAHPAHVIGLSLGGCVALALALARPGLVRHLVLVNTFAHYQAGQGATRARARRRLEVLLTGSPQQMAAFVADGLFPQPDQTELHAAAMASLAHTPRAVCFHALAAAARFDVRGKLGRIVTPTLVVSGARDTTVPARCSHELTLGIPGARCWVLPNSGHATPMDQAAIFNERVLQFLSGDAKR